MTDFKKPPRVIRSTMTNEECERRKDPKVFWEEILKLKLQYDSDALAFLKKVREEQEEDHD